MYAEPLDVPDRTPPAPAVPYVRPSIEGLGVVPALGAVARGLVTHLRRNYALTWFEGLPEDTLLPAGADWAVRLVPMSADAAPLTLAAYPNAIMVEAGALYMPSFPRRNSLEADLHALEQTTLALVEGRFAERFPGPEPDWYEHALAFPDGSQRGSGAGLWGALGAEALDAARGRLAALPNGWQPWPLRG